MAAERTYLDLPYKMAQEYMDTVFQNGPDCEQATRLREQYGVGPEWGKLFLELADAVDNLKRSVGNGSEE